MNALYKINKVNKTRRNQVSVSVWPLTLTRE